jgi:antiviral helicase SKI2
LLPEHEKAVKVSEADLAKVKRDQCDICDSDLDGCHRSAQEYQKLTVDLHLGLLATPIGKRMFTARRLVVYNRDGIRTPGLLLREGATTGAAPTVHVLEIRTRRDQRDSTDMLPYLPKYRKLFTSLPQIKKHISTKLLHIPVADLECLTNTVVKGIIPEIFEGGEGYERAKAELFRLCSSWQLDEWNELDFSRIKDLQLRDILAKRFEVASSAQRASCLQCPRFIKHVSLLTHYIFVEC